ncbi:MAG: hypothetical protein ACJ8CB_11580 [Ktedonobacteraceae bacterium]
MSQDTVDMPAVRDKAHHGASESIPAEQAAPASLRRVAAHGTLRNAALATQCMRELGNYQRSEPCDETYGLELLHRATLQDDPEAWVRMQDCFREMVRGWLRRHPSREAALSFESEENYVALAFERFWKATTRQRVAFETFAGALACLRASLHGAILDTLRAYSRPREVPLPQPGELGEPQVEDQSVSLGVWEALRTMLSNNRERRLAYLLYHCGLEPAEIVRYCPQEWSDVQEIARLRHSIFLRLMKRPEW